MSLLTFPAVCGTCLSIAFAIIISVHPPPQITLVSLTVSVNTHKASCNDRSASSSRWDDAPRRMIEQADPLLQPEKRMSLSSPTMISSMRAHSPRDTNSGLGGWVKKWWVKEGKVGGMK